MAQHKCKFSRNYHRNYFWSYATHIQVYSKTLKKISLKPVVNINLQPYLDEENWLTVLYGDWFCYSLYILLKLYFPKEESIIYRQWPLLEDIMNWLPYTIHYTYYSLYSIQLQTELSIDYSSHNRLLAQSSDKSMAVAAAGIQH